MKKFFEVMGKIYVTLVLVDIIGVIALTCSKKLQEKFLRFFEHISGFFSLKKTFRDAEHAIHAARVITPPEALLNPEACDKIRYGKPFSMEEFAKRCEE